MSVEKVKGGYENIGAAGGHGVMKSKADAERQKAAMFASGWRPGKADGGEVSGADELHRKIIQACLDHEMAGAAHDVIDAISHHEKADAESNEEPSESELDHVGEEDTNEPHEVSSENPDDEDETTRRIVEAFLAHSKR